MEIGVLLTILGFAVGALGTLIGVGGGIVLIPVLLFLYPHQPAPEIAAISLAVVACNALSGSIAYLRMGRVDWVSGALFALVMIPGAWVGVRLGTGIERAVYERMFGIAMALLALWILLRGEPRKQKPRTHGFERRMRDAEGKTYHFRYSLPAGLSISAIIGVLASFLGLGGGVIHVPVLSRVLGFPVHVATATSHLTLAITTLVASVGHYWNGTLTPGLDRVLWLAPGVVIGAQIGARLSGRVRGSVILRALGVALLLVAARLILR